MTVPHSRQHYLALVDDDTNSARLLTRMLLAHGAPSIRWLENAAHGLSELMTLLQDSRVLLPGLLIIDLKETSRATEDFIRALRALPRSDDLLIAAMAPSLDRSVRESLLSAGADAVFERHFELQAYRREAASMVSYWVRNQRLNAIGY